MIFNTCTSSGKWNQTNNNRNPRILEGHVSWVSKGRGGRYACGIYADTYNHEWPFETEYYCKASLTATRERPRRSACQRHNSPCLIASFFSLFSLPVHPVQDHAPTFFPFLSYTAHCLYSVVTASTKTPVGTDMYIN